MVEAAPHQDILLHILRDSSRGTLQVGTICDWFYFIARARLVQHPQSKYLYASYPGMKPPPKAPSKTTPQLKQNTQSWTGLQPLQEGGCFSVQGLSFQGLSFREPSGTTESTKANKLPFWNMLQFIDILAHERSLGSLFLCLSCSDSNVGLWEIKWLCGCVENKTSHPMESPVA